MPQTSLLSLKDILVDAIEINFTTCHKHVLDLISILKEYFKSNNIDLSKVRGSVTSDPFKSILKEGLTTKIG